ncbi:hypothetical protein D3C80_1671670 [compost metagenome]
MAGEAGEVRGHGYTHLQLVAFGALLQHLGRHAARRLQQGLKLRLGQLALGVERQLPQQAPASRQGQGFAMIAQVLAQTFYQCAAALVAQRVQAFAREH